MKTIKAKLLTIAMLLCSISVSSYDFKVDGIYYAISSMEELTVSVVDGDENYSGEIVIPEPKHGTEEHPCEGECEP